MHMTDMMSLEAAAQAMREAMRQTVKRHSLWYLIQSVLMVLGGVLALLYPLFSAVALTILIGWLLLISGIIPGISLISARSVPHFWLQLISVGLAVVVGLLFVRHPGVGLLPLTLLLIVYFMIEGLSKVIFALTIRPFPKWGWVLASGIIGILVSIYLLSNPATAAWLLGLLLGVVLVSEGASLGYLAWHVRKT
jgi:uncharacterized membrane protein HdeD (DUF308 family)